VSGEVGAFGAHGGPRALRESLAQTQQRIRVTSKTPADWCGPLYQTANRLAHVYWLHSLGVRAWLVHLLFLDDPHGPTSAAEWERALKQADDELGLTGLAGDAAGHVLLPAGTRKSCWPDPRPASRCRGP
jgi:hypothetical protein